MARTLTNIQTAVRYFARDDSIDLTTGTQLAITNRIYRGICNALPWPELRVVDVSLTSVIDQEAYTFPASPIFSNVTGVEIKSPKPEVAAFDEAIFDFDEFHDDPEEDSFKSIYPPPDEWEWNLQGRKSSVKTPKYYILQRSDSTNQILFRPTPSVAKTIRITGYREPTEFTAGSDLTTFIQANADDALERLLAADILFRDGVADQEAQRHLQTAVKILGTLFENKIITEELLMPARTT